MQREFAYLFTREITYIHVYIYTEILAYYDIDLNTKWPPEAILFFRLMPKNHKVLVIWDLNGYGEYEIWLVYLWQS